MPPTLSFDVGARTAALARSRREKGAADAAVLHIDALEREFAEPQCEEIT